VSDEVPSAPGGFTAGSRIAGYRLEEQIGQGGMAVVFRAHDDRLDRLVALKILAPGLALDDAFRQRFIRESRAAAAVDDPHIIPVFEAGEAGGVLFIAMRFVRGGDVRTLLETGGPLSPARATEIISQVATALDAAHAHGLVHRDVKPANMLLDVSAGADRPDHVYLSDFGLSKQSLAPSGLTSTGQFLGTLEYVAPEQIEGGPVDGRADLYALACAAFELLSGEPPFRRDEGLAVIYAQLSEPPPPLTSRRAGLPAGIDQVMAKAMAKSPADRYQSCRDFAAALREVLGLRPLDSGPVRSPAAERPKTEIAQQAPPPPEARPKTEIAAAQQAPPPQPGQQPAAPPQQPAAPPQQPWPQQESWPEPPPSAGPPTQMAGIPAERPTTPGLAGPYGHQGQQGQGGDGGYRPPGRRRWWRSRAVLAGACAVVLVIGGGAFALLHHSGGGSDGAAPAVTLPGCTVAVAKAAQLGKVSSAAVQLPGEPFAVRVSHDGRNSFATLGDSLAMLSNGTGPVPTFVRTIPVTGAKMKGAAITDSGSYLLAASHSGAEVIRIADAQQGAANPVIGALSSPGGKGAVQVATSPGDQFAFVTLQGSDNMAVFNLQEALSQGFATSGFVGFVPFTAQPVGIAQSSDGKWLYVTSIQKGTSDNPGQGQLSIISMHGAETKPATSVLRRVDAGCNPARVIVSNNGRDVWVSARQSNSLLGFSAARLQSDPAHALIVRVAVGANPIGLALVNGGTRIVVADSDQSKLPGAAPNLAVVSVTDALNGKPALLGLVKTGEQPRQFALEQGGKTLLVTNDAGRALQAVRLAGLP
jgi:serine/threonine protein kinase/DNA-binding beta-propeller fold protein YncE